MIEICNLLLFKRRENKFLNVNTNLFSSDWYMQAKRKLVGGGLMNFSVKKS